MAANDTEIPVHFNTVPPGIAAGLAMMNANVIAVQMSNAAVAAMKKGNYSEAIELHQKALALKLDVYPPESIQAAISYNGLGECLLKAGRLVEAEDALRKALKVRDLKENGGWELGPAMDSAVTRDNMGALFEAQGKWAEARDIRLSGSGRGQMICGNYSCPGPMAKAEKLKACAACKAVFYDSAACQKADWHLRHKVLCKSRKTT